MRDSEREPSNEEILDAVARPAPNRQDRPSQDARLRVVKVGTPFEEANASRGLVVGNLYPDVPTMGPTINIEIDFESHPIRAQLDCGAQANVGNRELVRKLISSRARRGESIWNVIHPAKLSVLWMGPSCQDFDRSYIPAD